MLRTPFRLKSHINPSTSNAFQRSFSGDMSLSQKGPLKCALEVQYRYMTQNS